MRLFALVVGFVVLAVAAAMAVGLVDFRVTQEGELPTVRVYGGQLPEIDADIADIELGSQQAAIEVPDVDVNSREVEVTVPTIDAEDADASDEPADRQ